MSVRQNPEVFRSSEDVERHYTPNDFSNIQYMEKDLGASPESDITSVVSQALSNGGNDTLIVFDSDGHYKATGDVTAPSNVDEWGLYSPEGVMTTIHTDNTVPKTKASKGLFGGYIIQRQNESTTKSAAQIHSKRPGDILTADPKPGFVDVIDLFSTGYGEDKTFELSADRDCELYAESVDCLGTKNSKTGIESTNKHRGYMKLSNCEVMGYEDGIKGPETLGGITVFDGYYGNNKHGIRLSGNDTNVQYASVDIDHPKGKGIVWDSGNSESSGGHIQYCDISIHKGQHGITSNGTVGSCTVEGCEIAIEDNPKENKTHTPSTGIKALSPQFNPDTSTLTEDQLAWSVYDTEIKGNGESNCAIEIEDRPGTRVSGMNIQMENSDGVIYKGDSTGAIENSVINVWGTSVDGNATVQDIDQTANR